jgi:uncharacterized protein YdaU (DUF1376 family)
MPKSKAGHFYYSWFPSLYAGATQHLTLAEDGAYRRLIDHYMTTKQPLPDNDAALARIVGVGREEWDAIKNQIKTYFKPSDNPLGFLRHDFCDAELGLHDARITKAIENGRKGGRPKTNLENDNALNEQTNKPVAFDFITQQKAEHNRTEHKKEKKENKTRARVALDDLTVDHISDWLAKKRAEGYYLNHDETFILEKFKDYCKSKGKKYDDFIAAYRNSFDWERFANGGSRPNQTGVGGQRIFAAGIPTKSERADAAARRAHESIAGDFNG